jgi:hypothetical protein
MNRIANILESVATGDHLAQGARQDIPSWQQIRASQIMAQVVTQWPEPDATDEDRHNAWLNEVMERIYAEGVADGQALTR